MASGKKDKELGGLGLACFTIGCGKIPMLGSFRFQSPLFMASRSRPRSYSWGRASSMLREARRLRQTMCAVPSAIRSTQGC